MYPLINKKKRETSTLSKVLYFGGHVLVDSGYGYLRWSDLETIMDNMIARLDKRPDMVIGIKTGGGILAGYVAKKLNTPIGFHENKERILQL
jgi:hypothetical protein